MSIEKMFFDNINSNEKEVNISVDGEISKLTIQLSYKKEEDEIEVFSSHNGIIFIYVQMNIEIDKEKKEIKYTSSQIDNSARFLNIINPKNKTVKVNSIEILYEKNTINKKISDLEDNNDDKIAEMESKLFEIFLKDNILVNSKDVEKKSVNNLDNKVKIDLLKNKEFISNKMGGDITILKVEDMYKMEYSFSDKPFVGGMWKIKDNWSNYKGICIKVIPDSSNNKLFIRFKQVNGEYWEENVILDKHEEEKELLFDDFKPILGIEVNKMNLSEIEDLNIYIMNEKKIKDEDKSKIHFFLSLI